MMMAMMMVMTDNNNIITLIKIIMIKCSSFNSTYMYNVHVHIDMFYEKV